MKKAIIIGLLLFYAVGFFAQNPNIDSIKGLEESSDSNLKAKYQVDLAWELMMVDDSAAIYYGNKAKNYYLETKKDTQLSETIYILGSIHSRNGRPDSAISNYLSALEIAEKIDLGRGTRAIVNAIGLLYKNIDAYDKAIVYYKKLYELGIESQDSIDISMALNNLGTVYYRQDSLDLALETHIAALAIRRKLGNPRWLASSLGSIGNVYGDLGQTQLALEYLLESLEVFRSINNVYGITTTLNNLGSTYLKIGDLKNAEKYLLETQELANSGSDIMLKINVLSRLSELYKKKNEYSKAYQALQLYSALRDSMVNVESNQRINELEVQYETQKKEKDIIKLKQMNQEKELIIAREKLSVVRRNRWITALAFSAVIIFLISLYIIQRNKRKAQSEKDQAIIAERDKGTQAVILAQEYDRKRIAKDLHDGVGQQLSGIKMAFQKLGKELKEQLPEKVQEIEKLTEVLNESADEIRSISHQMMPRALTELGIIEAMEDMLAKSLTLTGISYEFDHFGIEGRLNEKVELSIYRVAQELINNIIKHSSATQVNVQLYKNQNKLFMIVEDNGTGIKSSTNDGHGLLNIKSRINTLNGELNLEPSPTSGTLATIRIPI